MGQTVTGILAAAAILVALGVIIRALFKTIEVLRKLARLVDDLAGEPARPGFPDSGRPGLFERLKAMEDRQVAADARLARVEEQLKPNGGGSLRDTADRTADTAERIAAAVLAPVSPPPAIESRD